MNFQDFIIGFISGSLFVVLIFVIVTSWMIKNEEKNIDKRILLANGGGE